MESPVKAAPAAPNKFGVSDPTVLEQIEGVLTSVRISELALNPILGSFDAIHLRSTHRFIMQDVYETAGQCRAEGPHAKIRGLSDGSSHRVDYFNGEEIDAQLHAALASSSTRLGQVDPDDAASVAEWASSTYSDLDYIHAFEDGNSRTLRAFVSQMVSENTGMRLDWGMATSNKDGNLSAERDKLYRARDKAIIPKAIAAATNERTMFQLARALSSLHGAETLKDLVLIGLSARITDAEAQGAALHQQQAELVTERRPTPQ